MIHAKRRFSIATVTDAHELAKKLTQYTWCLCNGFRLGDLLFLNDSFSPDGAQEYAVFEESTGHQVESITFGWCDEETALKYIEQLLKGELRTVITSELPRTDHPPESCYLCA